LKVVSDMGIGLGVGNGFFTAASRRKTRVGGF
jgi:hypothetical protein